MADLRKAAQQALGYMKSIGQMDMYPEDWAIVGRLEAALAQQAEPVQEPITRLFGTLPVHDTQQAEPVEDVLLSAAGLALDALEHDRQAAARSGRSISMLSSRAIEELRGALRAALAHQAEPLNLRDPAVRKRLATQWGYVPAAQAEPVAGVVLNEEGRAALVEHGREEWHCVSRNARRLYTAPPQRKLVPLTEAEIEHIGITHQSLRQVARAVERAVWEKNNG